MTTNPSPMRRFVVELQSTDGALVMRSTTWYPRAALRHYQQCMAGPGHKHVIVLHNEREITGAQLAELASQAKNQRGQLNDSRMEASSWV